MFEKTPQEYIKQPLSNFCQYNGHWTRYLTYQLLCWRVGCVLIHDGGSGLVGFPSVSRATLATLGTALLNDKLKGDRMLAPIQLNLCSMV